MADLASGGGGTNGKLTLTTDDDQVATAGALLSVGSANHPGTFRVRAAKTARRSRSRCPTARCRSTSASRGSAASGCSTTKGASASRSPN